MPECYRRPCSFRKWTFRPCKHVSLGLRCSPFVANNYRVEGRMYIYVCIYAGEAHLMNIDTAPFHLTSCSTEKGGVRFSCRF